MLGYIQTGTEEEWSEKLSEVLVAKAHDVISGGEWKRIEVGRRPPHTFQTTAQISLP
jgi:hypothetical protein